MRSTMKSDALAIAFNAGGVDARRGLPPREDFGDASWQEIAAYYKGYDSPPEWRYER